MATWQPCFLNKWELLLSLYHAYARCPTERGCVNNSSLGGRNRKKKKKKKVVFATRKPERKRGRKDEKAREFHFTHSPWWWYLTSTVDLWNKSYTTRLVVSRWKVFLLYVAQCFTLAPEKGWKEKKKKRNQLHILELRSTVLYSYPARGGGRGGGGGGGGGGVTFYGKAAAANVHYIMGCGKWMLLPPPSGWREEKQQETTRFLLASTVVDCLGGNSSCLDLF